MTDLEPVQTTDLDSYIDNQLDPAGRLRVENWLAKNPDVAAQVMADLSVRSTLKLAMSATDASGRPETREAARRLSAGLATARTLHVLRKVAAVALLFSVGWFAHSSMGFKEVNASVQPPAFVEEAVRAHHTSRVRAAMQSQPEVKTYDRDEIRAATAITMPELPTDWKVVDVRIFPSDFGPSVEASVRTPDGSNISVFAGRPGYFAVEPVKDLNLSNAEAAWWQVGEVAYALVSSTPNIGLADEAETLKHSLY